MTAEPLKVLVVSGDRSLLRHISRFLGAFGYAIKQAADHGLAARALRADGSDLLIVDSEPSIREAFKLCRLLGQDDHSRPPHTFLLVREPDPQDLVDALEAGVDDFLAKPIVYGELLVRLRAGARARELQRRLQEQKRVEPVSRLLSESAFRRRLDRHLAAPADQQPCGSCVVADVDLLDRINAVEGRAAGDAVIGALADLLGGRCEESDLLGSLGGGRFAFWLAELWEEAAAEWAEQARAETAEATVATGQGELRFTASFGVAGRDQAPGDAQELLRRALEALQSAKASGRDCVARFGQFDDEAKAWEELTAPGKLFEGTLARDVMTPCPLVLQSDQSAAEAAALLRQTRLPALPVVDVGERLAGLVWESSLEAAPQGEEQGFPLLADVITTEAASYEEETPFSELMEFFKRASSPLVVVVRNGWPTGLVTLKSLAAMSEPLDSESFAPLGPDRGTSEYLLVNDSCLASED